MRNRNISCPYIYDCKNYSPKRIYNGISEDSLKKASETVPEDEFSTIVMALIFNGNVEEVCKYDKLSKNKTAYNDCPKFEVIK